MIGLKNVVSIFAGILLLAGCTGAAFAADASADEAAHAGKFLTVYKKSGGKWLILRDTWNSDAPSAPASPAPAAPAKK